MSLSMVLLTLSASPAAASDPIIQRASSNNLNVDAWSIQQLNPCERRVEALWAGLEARSSLPTPTPTATYSLAFVNRCTSQRRWIFGTAPTTTYRVAPSLSSAHVVATIPMTDVDTGAVAGTVYVDDVWTATDRAIRTHGSNTIKVPGVYIQHSVFHGIFRPAEVSGTQPFTGDVGMYKGTGRLTVIDLACYELC